MVETRASDHSARPERRILAGSIAIGAMPMIIGQRRQHARRRASACCPGI